VHKLTRQVRFSINPFLQEDVEGANPYASRPAGEGLSIFFELSVGLTGDLDRSTGFVMNVLDIDETVRAIVVPLFAKRIRTDFKKGRHIGLYELAGLLKSAREKLVRRLVRRSLGEGGSFSGGGFDKAVLSELTLKLNPFRKLSLECSGADLSADLSGVAQAKSEALAKEEDCKMIYFGEKFEFAAMHRLWNDELSDERNFALFGKCANPTGHGHNYVIEVTIEITADRSDFCIGDFEKIVDDEFIKHVDHKNLNVDVSGLSSVNPTVENIASFAWDRLVGKFSRAKLHCVTVWETDKTSCSYFGQPK
jgi:6-pyruvoyltetrahydropterin/6-carboxytetrahydropterin synthase